LSEDSSANFSLLSKYGIKFPATLLADSKESALAACGKVGFPLAMKVSSSKVLHKSDMGGVILGIKSREEAEKAYNLLMERYKGVIVDGVLVQRMASKSAVELIIGGKKDAQFGQLIMLGTGGIFVEVFRDVTFRVCPISKSDALEMISELRSSPILNGARGRKPVDKEAIASTLVKASKLLEQENPSEFDINPLMCDEKGCMAVDMRILR
jgi:acetyl-CoA synthetase (ADP-forming)